MPPYVFAGEGYFYYGVDADFVEAGALSAGGVGWFGDAAVT